MKKLKDNPCLSMDAIVRGVKEWHRARLIVDLSAERAAQEISCALVTELLDRNPKLAENNTTRGIYKMYKMFGIKVFAMEMKKAEWAIVADGEIYYSDGTCASSK